MSIQSENKGAYKVLRWISFLPIGILGAYLSVLLFMGIMDIAQSYMGGGFIGNLIKIALSAYALFGALGYISYRVAPTTNIFVVIMVVLVGVVFASFLILKSYQGMLEMQESHFQGWGKVKMYFNFAVAIIASIIGVLSLMYPTIYTEDRKRSIKGF